MCFPFVCAQRKWTLWGSKITVWMFLENCSGLSKVVLFLHALHYSQFCHIVSPFQRMEELSLILLPIQERPLKNFSPWKNQHFLILNLDLESSLSWVSWKISCWNIFKSLSKSQTERLVIYKRENSSTQIMSRLARSLQNNTLCKT